nr:DeoR/GlpR family DNA-binding transcription regulator [Kineosphaera limosa]
MIIRALGGQRTTVDALVALTGASPVTIRRDLADLEGHGLLKRVHGGAVAASRRGMRTQTYAMRANQDVASKESVAALVAGLIEEHETVVLDNGTTNDAVARTLVGRDLTVLCMSLHSAVALGVHPQAQVIVPGGVVVPDTLSATPAACIDAARSIRADVAVLGAAAASASHGLTTTTFDDAQIKGAIVACATHRILLADRAKLTRTASFRFAGLEDIDDLVTTADSPPDLLEEFRAAGVQVHLAPAAPAHP